MQLPPGRLQIQRLVGSGDASDVEALVNTLAQCSMAVPQAALTLRLLAESRRADQVWLSGGTCTRRPLRRSLAEIVVDVGLAIGYRPGNHVDAARYKVTDTVCQLSGDPTRWTHHVNDQCIVVGASFAARDAAVQAVRTGAQDCLVRLAYAPRARAR